MAKKKRSRGRGTSAGRRRTAKKAVKRGKASGKSAAKPARRWWLRPLVAVILATGMTVVLWAVYLDRQVTSTFEGRRWDLPSRVYARPLDLFVGRSLSTRHLQWELEAAGYRPVVDGGRFLPGRYQRSGGRFDLFLRGFHFADGASAPRRLRVVISGGQVRELVNPETGESLALARIDPAEIASIYPLDEEDRTLVDLEALPPLLVAGVQAVEDRQFKHHWGLDFRGIARAAVANLQAGEVVQGGSTLTQQLVKNLYLSADRTLWRKANEAVMALSLESHYEKAEILQAYFNEVYLGQEGRRAIHGVGRASEYYFGQPPERLEPHQIALLVGMIRGPSAYNPYRNAERATARRNRVLSIFKETGLLTDEAVADARKAPLDVVQRGQRGTDIYAGFVDLVKRQLRDEYEEEQLRSEGLRIFTTVAPSQQRLGQSAVTDGLSALGQSGMDPELEAAAVLLEPDSGEIRALIAGRDPTLQGFNRALDARRQIGSIIKPLVYLLALEHPADFSLTTSLEDEPVTLELANGDRWSPQNYDSESHGRVSLLQALIQSYNQATVRIGMRVGVRNVLRMLERFGLDIDAPAVPAVLLGAVEMSPLEVAQVYQSLAAGGYTVPLRAVTAVLTGDGELLSRYPLRLQPLEHRAAVSVLNYALAQVPEQGTARALPGLLGRPDTSMGPLAGKTGTTNGRRDSWYVGYTADWLGVVWVGRDDDQAAGVTGSNAALRLWAGMFRELDWTPLDLRLPEGAQYLWVDGDTGAASAADCPGAVQLPFVAGSEPTEMSPCVAQEEDRESWWRKWFGRKDDRDGG